MNLTKEVKDLFTEKQKKKKKKEKKRNIAENIKENTNKCRDTPYSWIGRLTIVKITQSDLWINAIPIKIPLTFFWRNRKKILKFLWNLKKKKKTHPWIVKTIFRRRNKAGGLTLSISNHITKLQKIKIVCYWHKDQWNRKRIQK